MSKTFDKDRPSAAARGYGRRWRKARLAYLLAHPLCVDCQRRGRIKAATVVDHNEPHRGDMDRFWDQTNWQPLCKSCHDGAKQRMEKSGTGTGCDHTGIPIDPSHPWRG